MRDFDYILWSQSETPTGKSSFIMDGKDIPDDEIQDYFSFISLHYQDKQHQWFQKFKDFPQKKKEFSTRGSLSEALSLYKDNMGNLLISSHYKETDKYGRNIVYALCSKGSDLRQACERLKEGSKIIHRTCNSDDILFLLSVEKNYKIYRIILIIILVISAIIWTIIKSC